MSEFRVNDIEYSEMPRERMARLGAAALSDKELVAILIGSGNKQKTVFEIAEDLTRHGRLYRELCRVNGGKRTGTRQGLYAPGGH